MPVGKSLLSLLEIWCPWFSLFCPYWRYVSNDNKSLIHTGNLTLMDESLLSILEICCLWVSFFCPYGNLVPVWLYCCCSLEYFHVYSTWVPSVSRVEVTCLGVLCHSVHWCKCSWCLIQTCCESSSLWCHDTRNIWVFSVDYKSSTSDYFMSVTPLHVLLSCVL